MAYAAVRRRSVAHLNARKGRKSIEKWEGDEGKGTAGERQRLFLLNKMHEDLGRKLDDLAYTAEDQKAVTYKQAEVFVPKRRMSQAEWQADDADVRAKVAEMAALKKDLEHKERELKCRASGVGMVARGVDVDAHVAAEKYRARRRSSVAAKENDPGARRPSSAAGGGFRAHRRASRAAAGGGGDRRRPSSAQMLGVDHAQLGIDLHQLAEDRHRLRGDHRRLLQRQLLDVLVGHVVERAAHEPEVPRARVARLARHRHLLVLPPLRQVVRRLLVRVADRDVAARVRLHLGVDELVAVHAAPVARVPALRDRLLVQLRRPLRGLAVHHRRRRRRRPRRSRTHEPPPSAPGFRRSSPTLVRRREPPRVAASARDANRQRSRTRTNGSSS